MPWNQERLVDPRPKLDDLATPDDNAKLNASTRTHGLLPKLPGTTTTFLRGDGTFTAVGGGGGGGGGLAAHAIDHQNGGIDEIDVTGLSGLLADAQTPLAHAVSHQNGGGDEVSVVGLSGLLADGQTPLAHAASHLSGGSDAVKLDDLAAPDDNTDLNASATAHGLMPKLVVPGVTVMVGSGADPPASGAIGKVNRTGQTAAIAAVNLTNATPAGMYQVSFFLRCTTADVTAGTIAFNVIYTDNVGSTTETSAVVALTSTVNRDQGSFVIYLASGNVTWSTTLIGIAGTSQYQIRARGEYLG